MSNCERGFDADEQHYDRHEIVFEPMPMTGRQNAEFVPACQSAVRTSAA
jgi:hypothetical protein